MSKIRVTLLSILEAIEKIEEYTEDFSDAETFYHEPLNFDATMMQFVIIGEMILKLDDKFKENHNYIPWQNIKNFRNIVAHNYFGIDSDEIWEIIQRHIPTLKNDIQKLIK
jgi:uncharacterized protein with HEPN domain